MLATPPRETTELTMCLLHGDFHLMHTECWDTALDFYFSHQHLGERARWDAYLMAVEQRMLDDLLPKRRPAAGSR